MTDPDDRGRVPDAMERWRAAHRNETVRAGRFQTSSEIPVSDLYTPADLDALDYAAEVGFPGEPPFTRGVQATMYRGRVWTMRQYAGFASAEETNRRFRFLLDQGQTGLSVAFDLPTQLGLDSDDALSEGEVGKVGVAIDTVDDVKTLFDGIPLDRVSTSMTINAPAAVLLAMYVTAAREQGIAPAALTGTVQNDILKEYVARGTYIFPTAPSLRLVGDLVEYCSRELPEFNTLSVSGYHIREAGATALQELAFTLADGIAYVEAVTDRGLPVDAFAPRIAFFFNAHNQILEEVAKFRAARLLWAGIMRDRFHARDPRSMKLRFHTQTAGSTLAARQPLNNVVRVAIQALAAVLGGTQSLHTNAWDEAIGLPTEASAAVALRTQQVIAHESGLADVVDPLGGSFVVETWTRKLASGALDLIRRIDEMGGMPRAIESGFVQEQIETSAYQAQKAFEAGEQVVIGVNRYRSDEAGRTPALRVDPALEQAARAKLARLKESRDGARVLRSLDQVEAAAATAENLMTPLIDAVEARATLGEITRRLKRVFGEFKP